MAFTPALDTTPLQPIFSIISMPLGTSQITLGEIIIMFILFYIIAQEGNKWR